MELFNFGPVRFFNYAQGTRECIDTFRLNWLCWTGEYYLINDFMFRNAEVSIQGYTACGRDSAHSRTAGSSIITTTRNLRCRIQRRRFLSA